MAIRLFCAAASVLLICSWLISNHYAPWAAFYNEFSIFLACIFLGGIVVLMCPVVNFGASAVVLLCCASIPLLQLAAGLIGFAGDALIVALYILAFSGVLVFGNNLAGTALRLQTCTLLAMLMVLGAVFSTYIALNQWLMLSGGMWVADLNPGGRPYANLAQPNNLATLLCLGLAGVLYLFETRRLGSWAGSALAFFLLFGVVLTQSRTPWVGAMCALFWWGWKCREVVLRLSLTSFVGWVALYALLVCSFFYLSDALYLSVDDLGSRAQAAHRWGLWQQLLQAVLQGPFWGYGWAQVSVAQVSVSLSSPLPLMTEHSHNILLDLLIWNGSFIGGLIILLLGVWLVRLGLRARTRESVFALLAVGFVLVHGMLEYPLEYAYFLLPVALLLGMVEGELRVRALFTLPRWVLVGGLLISLGAMVWIFKEYRIVEEDHRLMRFETARIGILKAEKPAPDVVLLTQLREFIRFARTEATPGMTDEQLDWMRKVAHRYPYPSSMLRYSMALGLNGQADLARQEFLRLRALHGEQHYQDARQIFLEMQKHYSVLALIYLP